MEVPSPSYREYVTFVATAVITLAVIEYAGVLSESPGQIRLGYLIGVALVLPISIYLLTLVLANVESVPQWDKMVRTEE